METLRDQVNQAFPAAGLISLVTTWHGPDSHLHHPEPGLTRGWCQGAGGGETADLEGAGGGGGFHTVRETAQLL